MPKLSALVADNATVSVPFGDEVVTVRYRPSVITPGFQRAIAEAQARNDFDGAVCWPLSALIVGWDLQADDGATVPTTPESMAAIPGQVLNVILAAIREDLAPNPSSAASSVNGSSRTDGSGAVPTGT